MKIMVSQLRRIFKEEVRRALLESPGGVPFNPGDLVRTKNERYGAPMYSSKPDGSPDVARGKASELPATEDVEVIEVDPAGDMVKVATSRGDEGWVIGSFLAPASGKPRKAAAGKEFMVTFIGARGGSREMVIVAKDVADAETKATKLAKPGEQVEVDEI